MPVSTMFFRLWPGSALIASVVFFIVTTILSFDLSYGWGKTMQILTPTFLLFCQIPALGFLWHSRNGAERPRDQTKTLYLVPLIYGCFIGAIGVCISYY